MTPSRAALYDAFGAPTHAGRAADFVCAIAAAHDVYAPFRLLDVGCGTGALFSEYGSRGVQVTGLEPDADFRTAALERAKDIEVRAGGFADIEDRAVFDVVAAINGPLYYLTRPADRADALARCFRALRPGGVLVLDLANFVAMLPDFRESVEHGSTLAGRPVVLVRRHSVDPHDATFLVDESYAWVGESAPFYTQRYTLGIVTFPEIDHIARAAGFEDVRTYTSFTSRAPHRLDGTRLIVSARRPVA
jgi:SAM-dependent methyltransferase